MQDTQNSRDGQASRDNARQFDCKSNHQRLDSTRPDSLHRTELPLGYFDSDPQHAPEPADDGAFPRTARATQITGRSYGTGSEIRTRLDLGLMELGKVMMLAPWGLLWGCSSRSIDRPSGCRPYHQEPTSQWSHHSSQSDQEKLGWPQWSVRRTQWGSSTRCGNTCGGRKTSPQASTQVEHDLVKKRARDENKQIGLVEIQRIEEGWDFHYFTVP